MAKLQYHNHPDGNRFSMIATFDDDKLSKQAFIECVLKEAARLMAERIVAEKFQEVVAAIDVQAIANLSVAEAASEIHKTLKEKIPDKVVEIHRTQREVYQRGVFGSLTRVS